MSESEFVKKLERLIKITEGMTVAGVASEAGLDKSTLRKAFSAGSMNTTSQEKVARNVFKVSVAKFLSPDFPPPDGQEQPLGDLPSQISDLVSELYDHERRQLLGYAEALLASRLESNE